MPLPTTQRFGDAHVRFLAVANDRVSSAAAVHRYEYTLGTSSDTSPLAAEKTVTADEIATSGQLREVTRFFTESLQIWST